MKKCMYCSEEIQDTAIKCRYCGEKVVKYSSDGINNFIYTKNKFLRLCIGVLFLFVAFFIYNINSEKTLSIDDFVKSNYEAKRVNGDYYAGIDHNLNDRIIKIVKEEYLTAQKFAKQGLINLCVKASNEDIISDDGVHGLPKEYWDLEITPDSKFVVLNGFVEAGYHKDYHGYNIKDAKIGVTCFLGYDKEADEDRNYDDQSWSVLKVIRMKYNSIEASK